MFITLGDTEYELKNTLGVAERIETKFKKPLTEILAYVEAAVIPELITIIAIAAGMTGDAKLPEDIKDNWDYIELQTAVQELLARMMFSGTPEQVETKIEKFPGGEDAKNAIRGLLGIPIPVQPTPSTGNA